MRQPSAGFEAEPIRNSARETIFRVSDSIRQLADKITDDFAFAVQMVFESPGRVIVTGIGKSAIIAGKIVATLNSTGTPSIFMHAADAIHGDLGIIQDGDIVICLSKSGNTPEIKVLVPLIRNLGNPLIAIVGNLSSYLAQQADLVIDSTVEREACPNNLAPTTSTTAQLVMGDALAVALLQLRGFSPEDFARFHPGGSLGKKLYTRVSDLLKSQDPPWVKPDDDIRRVIMEISSKRLGVTAVCNPDRSLIGVITDGDLRRMLENNSSFDQLSAASIMTPHPKTIGPDEMAIRAFQLMESHKITSLAVVENQIFIGIIHIHDIVREGIV